MKLEVPYNGNELAICPSSVLMAIRELQEENSNGVYCGKIVKALATPDEFKAEALEIVVRITKELADMRLAIRREPPTSRKIGNTTVIVKTVLLTAEGVHLADQFKETKNT